MTKNTKHVATCVSVGHKYFWEDNDQTRKTSDVDKKGEKKKRNVFQTRDKLSGIS